MHASPCPSHICFQPEWLLRLLLKHSEHVVDDDANLLALQRAPLLDHDLSFHHAADMELDAALLRGNLPNLPRLELPDPICADNADVCQL